MSQLKRMVVERCEHGLFTIEEGCPTCGRIAILERVLVAVARIDHYEDGRSERCWCHHQPYGGPRSADDHEQRCLNAHAALLSPTREAAEASR